MQHTASGHEHFVLAGQRHRISCCSCAGRNDRYRVDRTDILQLVEQNRVPAFMISGNALFLLGNDMAFLLRTDADFDKRLLNIRLNDICAVFLCSVDRCLVQEVLEIRTGKAGCRSRNFFQIDIVSKRLVLRVYL